METNNQPIETYLPIFTGFYGSIWEDPNFDGEAEHYKVNEKFPFYDYFNYGDYHNELSRNFCDLVESYMSDFIEKIEFQRLKSPKEYNFSNDSIYCLITPKIQEITTYLTGKKEQLTQYLQDHLKSRDGFHSFYQYSYEFWHNRTYGFTKFDTEGLDLGFFLQFIAEQEELLDCLMNAEEPHVSEFYNEDFDEAIERAQILGEYKAFIKLDINDIDEQEELLTKIQAIHAFVKNNYTKLNVAELTIKEFSEQEFGYNELSDILDIPAIVNNVMNEIEVHTLKLEL